MIKIGVIGVGRIGKRHITHISNFASLSFICDINQSQMDEYKCLKFKSIKEIINNLPNADIVAVCTPNGLHCNHTVKLLNAGYNVLVEKPMALNQSDCLLMMRTAEKNNKRLFVVKQNRFNSAVVEVKKLLDQDLLGKIYSFHLNCIWNRDSNYYKDSWKGTLDLDGGTLYTQFSHFVDLIIWMFGCVENCTGYSKNFNHKKIIEFEDCGVVSLEMDSGILGSIHYSVNSFKSNMEGSLMIIGENGTVKIGGEYLNEIDYFNVKNLEKPRYDRTGQANDYGKYKGSMSNHDKVYKNLIDVLVNNDSINTSSVDGLYTTQAIQKIYDSIRFEKKRD